MRFTRIKVTEKAVELDWIEKLANGETKTIGLQSPNRPLPALLNALAAFRTYVADLLDLPSWADELRVTTLKIDEGKDGRRGLIVTCVRPIEKASMRVLVLNTPRMGEGALDGGERAYDDVIDLNGKEGEWVTVADVIASTERALVGVVPT